MTKKKRKPRSDRYIVIKVQRIDDPQVWQRKSRGVSTGLSVYEYLGTLFDANEILPTTKKLTDESILQAVVKEFPGRKSTKELLNRSLTINELRGDYNAGRLTGIKPEVVSKRYTMDGREANGRTGRALEEKK